jgi:hypothetical protein
MLEETVSQLLYEYFKQERIVEHLMEMAARYTRYALVFPLRADESFRYLSGWVTALTQLRDRLTEYVAQDEEWLALERAARTPTDPPPSEIIQSLFETQIDWCLTFFETCVEYTFTVSRRGQGQRPRTRRGFDRFTTRAQQAWTRLTHVDALTRP